MQIGDEPGVDGGCTGDGHGVSCELLVWSAAEVPGKQRDRAAAAVHVAQRRMDRQASISKLVSTEMAGWVQGLALMVIGMLLSICLGLRRNP